MTDIVHQPHDKLFKTSLSDVRVARDFFEHHLPKDILQDLDLFSLECVPQSFIDEDFQATEADIVYQAKLKSNDILLYTLCEHTSKPDRWLPLRQKQYCLRALEQYQKQNGNKPLPLVYSLIVYTGEEPYRYSTDFFDLFGEHGESAKEYWLRPTPLIDVCREPDEEIQKRPWFGIVELAFKYRYARQPFEQCLELLINWLNKLERMDGDRISKDVIFYVVSQYEEIRVNLLLSYPESTISPKLKGEAMTYRARPT